MGETKKAREQTRKFLFSNQGFNTIIFIIFKSTQKNQSKQCSIKVFVFCLKMVIIMLLA